MGGEASDRCGLAGFWFTTFLRVVLATNGCCCFQGKIYMYGGKIDSTGNVSSQLWLFHIHNQTWVLLSPQVTQDQYAVVGHSAHIVPPVQRDSSPTMLVLFGHCPLYGYISQVQEYDIGKMC